MAKDALRPTGKVLQPLEGVDESNPLAADDATFAKAAGISPFFYGIHQRMSGKKIIDYNPNQKISAIHQTFNGVCLYGYYVETDQKLYFHVCDAPPDLRIKFTPFAGFA